MRHPDHDSLCLMIRGLYTHSHPEMGYIVQKRRYGFYVRNVKVVSSETNQVIIRDISPGLVKEFLADLRGYYGDNPVYIRIDDRKVDEEIALALVAAGCLRGSSEVLLAHVGEPPQDYATPDVTIEAVTPSNLSEYAKTKLMAFSDTELSPNSDELSSEIALREAELEGEGRFLLARVGSEPAGIIGWYDLGNDRLIFQVAVRLPFRHRGIAKKLILHVASEAYRHKYRSVIISADPEDTPINIWRGLGFTDEIYWRCQYQMEVQSAPKYGTG